MALFYYLFSGLMYVRGCEVEGLLDENGRVIEEFAVEKPKFTSGNRTFRVLLDCNQYYTDMDATSKGGEDVYSSFLTETVVWLREIQALAPPTFLLRPLSHLSKCETWDFDPSSQ